MLCARHCDGHRRKTCSEEKQSKKRETGIEVLFCMGRSVTASLRSDVGAHVDLKDKRGGYLEENISR